MTGSFAFLVLPITVLVSPLILSITSKQSPALKQRLRYIYQISLVLILALAFFNWETFETGGRNAFALASDLKNVFLYLFLAITFIQTALLLAKKYSFDKISAAANFINTFVFFAAAITISNNLGRQIVSPAIITVAMMVLVNNVIGLVLVNKDRRLLSKYIGRTKK